MSGMDPELFEQFIDQLERYVRERLIPAEREVIEADRIPDAIVQEMRDMGLFGLTVPEEYGGAGLSTSPIRAGGQDDGLCRAGLPLDLLDQRRDVQLGDQERRHRGAEGRMVAAHRRRRDRLLRPDRAGLAAPTARRWQTTARPDPSGNGWILNGTKRYITNAPHAAVGLIMARTEKEALPKNAHVSAFIVPMDTPGVTVGRPDKKMGQSGSHIADVILEDVHVPGEALLGGETGKGFVFAMKSLDNGRISVGAAAHRLCAPRARHARCATPPSARRSASRSPTSS